MSIIVLDIETTGLPIRKKYNSYYRSSSTNYYDSSRIIELGYQIFDQDGRLILEEDDLILNDYEITNSHIHGITQDEIKTKGITIKESFDKLYKNLKNCSKIVAHNINFDFNIILSELYRLNDRKLINKFNSLDKICTMELGKKYLNSKKYPKLVNLYQTIFNTKITQNHRALDDTKLCSSCYFYMKRHFYMKSHL